MAQEPEPERKVVSLCHYRQMRANSPESTEEFADMLSLVEDCLAKIKMGEVRSVAIVMELPDDHTATAFSLGDNGRCMALVYGMEWCKARLFEL